jgi:hypothetical protein
MFKEIVVSFNENHTELISILFGLTSMLSDTEVVSVPWLTSGSYMDVVVGGISTLRC